MLGGHFDSFDGGTGGVDNGSGFTPGMEAMRLIKAAGGAPKRSIVMILFAAEENGLVGSQSWLRRSPELHSRIMVMINRDGSPSAITGASVPPGWMEAMEEIAAPLAQLDPRWPFTLTRNDYPSARPERPGGSDHSSFQMLGIPTLGFRVQTDYVYGRAWHTLYDLYSELVPYAEHQEHSALVTAVVAYGLANAEPALTPEGFYLEDGLYADILTSAGARVMASLDFGNAPLQAAYLVRLAQGSAPAGAGPGGPGGPGRPGGPPAAVGRIVEAQEGVAGALLEFEGLGGLALADLPLPPNPAVRHDAPGVLGLSGSDAFYLTREARPELDGRYTALGRVIAGAHLLGDLAPGDQLRSIRIIRAGEAARAFRTDDEAFAALLEAARRR